LPREKKFRTGIKTSAVPAPDFGLLDASAMVEIGYQSTRGAVSSGLVFGKNILGKIMGERKHKKVLVAGDGGNKVGHRLNVRRRSPLPPTACGRIARSPGTRLPCGPDQTARRIGTQLVEREKNLRRVS